jgi:hypothetical protein
MESDIFDIAPGNNIEPQITVGKQFGSQALKIGDDDTFVEDFGDIVLLDK